MGHVLNSFTPQSSSEHGQKRECRAIMALIVSSRASRGAIAMNLCGARGSEHVYIACFVMNLTTNCAEMLVEAMIKQIVAQACAI